MHFIKLTLWQVKTFKYNRYHRGHKYHIIRHDFYPQNPEIYTDIIQHKSILHRNEELHQCFRNKTFLKSKRQPPNLKRLLTKAKFTMKQTEECSVKKCNEPRCGLCKYTREGSSIKFKNKSFKVNENMSCKAKKM